MRTANAGSFTSARLTKHGMHATPTWAAWKDMKRRCLKPEAPNYHRYGGRGISVCDSWKDSFQNFLNDMGVRPDGMTLERLNNNGDYNPTNCAWAPRSVQASNTRRNRRITIDGISKTIREWAREVGMNRSAIRHRLEAGWTDRDAVFTKSRRPCR